MQISISIWKYDEYAISGEPWKCKIRDQLWPKNWCACLCLAWGYCGGDYHEDEDEDEDDDDDDDGDDDEEDWHDDDDGDEA